jgi:hypothetical protein
MVGAPRFELGTSCSRRTRAVKPNANSFGQDQTFRAFRAWPLALRGVPRVLQNCDADCDVTPRL